MELINQEHIENKIFTIRNKQVMLDNDLAELYQVSTGRLNEQVKRNNDRFPLDFMFQLSEQEWEEVLSQNAVPNHRALRSQNAILKQKRGQHRKYLPYVFTEQGVAGLSGILKSERAVKVHVEIMRAFVTMRKFLLQNASVFQRLDQLELKQLQSDEKFNQIFKALEAGQPKPDKGIFFDGQVFDAYAFVSDLIKRAKKEIILIDNYIDESVLTLLSKRQKDVTATIYTKSISKTFQLDLDKHHAQYPELQVRTFAQCHDRFLLIDQSDLYQIGASLKDLGKKPVVSEVDPWFAFSRMDSMTALLLN
ncbi:ORF6N domain-containing protein [Aquiflexum balticum DSM 16537]|uniref:ORF6N domain-containing protein n=1 Tax=Aquiflexum balticum DSM 16537 TaxID=758820 RepID=A0A1W2HBW6_9BACT|nr:ORF6N domain-containing protein [Aquiflexum balticum]SMD46370.1 ORF6N domain-containing protein [Aquiflexum balticum DSM 16537]